MSLSMATFSGVAAPSAFRASRSPASSNGTVMRMAAPSARPSKSSVCALRSDFLSGGKAASFGFSSTLTGLSLGLERLSLSTGPASSPLQTSAVLQGANKGSRTRRSRAGASGFRARLSSVNGRKVLAARRKKGRHNLVPASSKPDKRNGK